MKNLLTLLPTLALAVTVMTSCGTEQTLIYESGAIPLVAEGPLFEGTNTAQGSWEPGIEAFLKEQGAELGQLREARVVGAYLSASDQLGFQGIRSVSIMIASDAQDMQQVAVLNPFPADQGRAELTTATEQKGLAGHLREHAVTVVADLDLDGDNDEDRHVIGSFTIELTIKR